MLQVNLHVTSTSSTAGGPQSTGRPMSSSDMSDRQVYMQQQQRQINDSGVEPIGRALQSSRRLPRTTPGTRGSAGPRDTTTASVPRAPARADTGYGTATGSTRGKGTGMSRAVHAGMGTRSSARKEDIHHGLSRKERTGRNAGSDENTYEEEDMEVIDMEGRDRTEWEEWRDHAISSEHEEEEARCDIDEKNDEIDLFPSKIHSRKNTTANVSKSGKNKSPEKQAGPKTRRGTSMYKSVAVSGMDHLGVHDDNEESEVGDEANVFTTGVIGSGRGQERGRRGRTDSSRRHSTRISAATPTKIGGSGRTSTGGVGAGFVDDAGAGVGDSRRARARTGKRARPLDEQDAREDNEEEKTTSSQMELSGKPGSHARKKPHRIPYFSEETSEILKNSGNFAIGDIVEIIQPIPLLTSSSASSSSAQGQEGSSRRGGGKGPALSQTFTGTPVFTSGRLYNIVNLISSGSSSSGAGKGDASKVVDSRGKGIERGRGSGRGGGNRVTSSAAGRAGGRTDKEPEDMDAVLAPYRGATSETIQSAKTQKSAKTGKSENLEFGLSQDELLVVPVSQLEKREMYDRDVWAVEEILDERKSKKRGEYSVQGDGKRGRKRGNKKEIVLKGGEAESDVEYLVKWEGYEAPTWENDPSIRLTEAYMLYKSMKK